MTAGDPLAFLFSLERLGMKFGLETMAQLCARLDHPERAFRSVLVAGTNGKGSVTVMVEAALRTAGHRTARYTSPHLERLEERFAIGGHEVATDELRTAVERVREASDTLPTFFECATAAAFELFRRHAVDVAVLEVGLGGRLDATNVVTPVCTAITSIGLDHQAQLGDTIESIAWEKAGIAKPAVPLVCGSVPAAADAVIGRVCAERGAPLRRIADRVRVQVHRAAAPPVASFETAQRQVADVTLSLDGPHQIGNAAVAIAVLDTLADARIGIDDAAVRSGLSSAEWPGRMERTAWRGAEILLDGAHNPEGAHALAVHLAATGWNDVTLVFGVMRDKAAAAMLAALAPRCREIVLTAPATPRALPAAELAALASAIEGLPPTVAIADPAEAIAHAAAAGGRVVVAGSLFLIGPLRGILR